MVINLFLYFATFVLFNIKLNFYIFLEHNIGEDYSRKRKRRNMWQKGCTPKNKKKMLKNLKVKIIK